MNQFARKMISRSSIAKCQYQWTQVSGFNKIRERPTNLLFASNTLSTRSCASARRKKTFGSQGRRTVVARKNGSKLHSGTVDYSVPPPIIRSPPPPPPRKGARKYFFPFTLLVAFGFSTYIYFNNQNDSYEYWEAVQSGGALPGEEFDDDEYDDDDYDEDEDE
mmetsp:Transcript_7736/g.11273  ORF Transcript_7736/g.11273 Transcript_7736/m.11273 type:complete len:163 (+) Transcript_7736:60-548(+)|eukprot:CAMPEP_0195513026 /NCGR_PEP_ID=MMETSP0794_2-20130614/4789_1 /TAXON_ID=515487 /ORGANISM="Stephanopyxis turris, Strain CCMP 815" /LENGTH=162 /DNA_ID=CAMNT_0040640941 /DNA_START=53 /DNA_END=541 /DNA_ORIENTATION=-